MIVRLAISVEGYTELEFCREVLSPHLLAFDVYLEPKIVVTQRNIIGPNAKGGSVSLGRFNREVRPLLYSLRPCDHLVRFPGISGPRGRRVARRSLRPSGGDSGKSTPLHSLLAGP